MAKRIRTRLTYANVTATLALFLAVAGGATALAVTLTKNSVKSRHIAPGAVRTSDLHRNAATGAKVKESTLGRVPAAEAASSAGLLDGIDSLGFARPAAVASDQILEGTPLHLAVPGYVDFYIYCDDDPASDSGDAAYFTYQPHFDAPAVDTSTFTHSPSQGLPGVVQLFGGAASESETQQDNNVGIVYRLAETGSGRGIVVFAQAHEKFGSAACLGSIQAFRIG